MRLARETVILGGICVADLASTIWLVRHQGATEGNGLMRYYLSLGLLPFIAAKFLMFGAPLSVLEWARRRRPTFVRGMLRAGIALYLLIYGVGVWRVNRPAEAETQSDNAIRRSFFARAPLPGAE